MFYSVQHRNKFSNQEESIFKSSKSFATQQTGNAWKNVLSASNNPEEKPINLNNETLQPFEELPLTIATPAKRQRLMLFNGIQEDSDKVIDPTIVCSK